ncbi:hypothetical protein QQF64_025842 [Cirrhinus molitorella]|uniref:Transposase n=1 Tax=Cirrhinus molitorella TaxID=172907 RepID=A0ABR3NQG5_9TELE
MAKQRRVSDEALELIFSNESFGDELTDASGSDADTWCSEEEYSRGIDPFEDNAFSLFTAIDMSKRLTREERIKIVLISGERSNRVIAADLNARHPTRAPISHATVSKLLAKFRETGSVLDLPKCGRMKTVTNEETSVAVLASFSKSPQCSTLRMSLESGISRTSLRRILATHKWHPYKLQLLQHLNEDDPDQRTEFAEWAKQKLEQDPQFTQKILFSDEANFYVNANRMRAGMHCPQLPACFPELKKVYKRIQSFSRGDSGPHHIHRPHQRPRLEKQRKK